MVSRFQKMRMKMMGADEASQPEKQEIDLEQTYNSGLNDYDDNYYVAVEQAKENLSKSNQPKEEISKGLDGKQSAYTKPILGNMNMNPGYKEPANGSKNLNRMLQTYSNNHIVNAIINTRANQVSLFTQPVRYSEKGMGFQVRLKDFNAKASVRQQKEMSEIEDFLLNTGKDKSTNRGTLVDFIKQVVRDTYIYDQVNFEKVFDKKGNFLYFVPVDPSTIYFGVDEDGNVPEDGERYVQVLDGRIVQRFTPKEMAFAVRNPRSSIYGEGYGYSEVAQSLHLLAAQENTERFNDRFFSHGGTTRGVLHIKTPDNQSQQVLDMFKREWQQQLSGINGSWKIPIVNAEDIKFVNMTPSANDMQFESWLNLLINSICGVFQIDPAEINFPNRGGGATGSGGGISMNEESSIKKAQASQNKGLLPLLKFVENTINRFIMSEFSDEYLFSFIGGDVSTELQNIRILAEKTSFAMTVDEAREALGLEGKVVGGDIPANGVVVQSRGQTIQQENFEYQKQQDRLNLLLRMTTPPDADEEGGGGSVGLSFQDIQQGLAGNADNVNGKDTTGNVGKDGQAKDQTNANKDPQPSKGE